MSEARRFLLQTLPGGVCLLVVFVCLLFSDGYDNITRYLSSGVTGGGTGLGILLTGLAIIIGYISSQIYHLVYCFWPVNHKDFLLALQAQEESRRIITVVELDGNPIDLKNEFNRMDGWRRAWTLFAKILNTDVIASERTNKCYDRISALTDHTHAVGGTIWPCFLP